MSARQRWASHFARVGTRLTLAFLAVSLLIPIVGWIAIREQYASSARAARIEARHVAEQIAAYTTQADSGRVPLYQDPAALQRYVGGVHVDQQRDVEVVDTDRRILADALPANLGKPFNEGAGGEVSATLRDGQPRTFTERNADYPDGIQVVVVPMYSDDKIVGAVLLEYTPIYQTLVDAGKPTREIIIAASIGGTVAALVLGLMLSRGIIRGLEELTTVTGRFADGDDTARAAGDVKGEIGELAVAFNDMADSLAAQKATLTELAGTDSLTGLNNRRVFLSRLRVPPSTPTALLMLDLDHFKAINDERGHAGGDAALAALAQLIQTHLRAQDVAARLGGEEFAILLPGVGQHQAVAIAERLRAAIAAYPIVYRGERFMITTSIGVVTYPQHASTTDALLQAGDDALYAAKRAGRDRIAAPAG
jgi:diguanylate cyclase (GGDEF)-like protein